jgi:Lrp/AsnC family transcriptional regulator, leucine-responsive regulatory protein
MEIHGLDRIDRKILAILQQDGRITTTDLAEQVGLSATAITERVKRLTREGIILGYGARLDPAKLGRGLLVFVEVLLERTSPDSFDTFQRSVLRSTEVLECHMVAGGFDYLIKARVADMGAYRQFLAEVVHSLPGVRETRTYAVMEEVKETGILPL